jgi:ABC-type antimicrobial peptide transport system permease subunit
MAKNNRTKMVDTIIDFIIIIGVSMTIFFGAGLLGAPIWLQLLLVALWGGYTGYKPKIVRKPFSFMYRDDEKDK